jgi:hypothetical protein
VIESHDSDETSLDNKLGQIRKEEQTQSKRLEITNFRCLDHPVLHFLRVIGQC